MSCEKYIFELRASCDEEVNKQTYNQDGHGFNAQYLLCHRYDCLVVRHNARDMKTLLNHLAERIQIFYDEARACTEHQISENRL